MPFLIQALILLIVCLLVGAVISGVLFYLFSLTLGLINKKWLEYNYEPIFFIIALFFVGTYYGICLSNIYDKDKGEPSAKESNTNEEEKDVEVVYICTSGTSKRYHSDRYCSGLGRCIGEIDEMSVDEAENMGRTPCHICY